jgi:hypothetical protein
MVSVEYTYSQIKVTSQESCISSSFILILSKSKKCTHRTLKVFISSVILNRVYRFPTNIYSLPEDGGYTRLHLGLSHRIPVNWFFMVMVSNIKKA